MKITKINKLAVVNSVILDGKLDMTPLHNRVVLIEKDEIKSIITSEEWEKFSNKAEYKILDAEGKFLLPGLINMHVHLAGNGKPQKKQRDNEALVKKILSTKLTRYIAYKIVCKFAQLELFSGVTTIRTVGGLSDFDSRCRNNINSGKLLGPRILAANQGISVPNGHMAGSVAIAAKSVDEALSHLDTAKNQGVDLVKLMVTGGVLDAKEKGVPGEVKMSGEMIYKVCEKAHKMGYKVAAHVESPAGVKLALQNGVDSIEHGAKTDEEMLQLFKDKNAFLCTTISPALPYACFERSVSHASEIEQFNGNVVFEGIIDCSKNAIKNNIPVALGNDVGCPYITQYDFWREPYYFNKYVGVSKNFALHTATQLNAELAGIGKITGTIEEGKKADIIMTCKNPLDDLRVLRKVEVVIAGGNLIEKPKIKRNTIVDRELDKFCD